MRKLILASKNIKKLKELKEILPAGWDAILATDINPTINWNESGDTFEANSRIKALAVRKFAQNAAVLADDSGLSVNALDGSPGVYSARFAGIEGDDAANNAKLLQALSKFLKKIGLPILLVAYVLSMKAERNPFTKANVLARSHPTPEVPTVLATTLFF